MTIFPPRHFTVWIKDNRRPPRRVAIALVRVPTTVPETEKA